ncbi:MAG TPA: hypothetical protein DEQ61_01760, partial [Streptomyces sp.]|nr:hypothetical protein [Streptomyces sp.]
APSASARATGGPTPSSPGAAGPSPGASPPAGFRRVREPAGYSVDVPDSWQRDTERDSVFFRADDDDSLIQIYELTEPGMTPFAAMEETDAYVSAQADEYRQIRLERVRTDGAAGGDSAESGDTAELEYTHLTQDDTVRHTLVRGFTAANSVRYALLFAAPDDEWAGHQEILEVLHTSFCPGEICAAPPHVE